MTCARTRTAHDGLAGIGAGLGSRPALARLLASAEHHAADLGAVASMLRRTRTSPPALAEIGARSVWHPNGFAKIVLSRDERSGSGVRMHVWPEDGNRTADSNPHSHRWDFASALLVGPGLRITEFAECAAGDLYQRCFYGGSGPHTDGLVATGRVALRRTGETVWVAGTAYPCATTVLHTVEPLGHALMATLVLQGPRRPVGAAVYRREHHVRDHHVRDERPVPLGPGELERVLDEVSARLDRRDEVSQ